MFTHISLHVTNLTASVHYYKDILGCSVKISSDESTALCTWDQLSSTTEISTESSSSVLGVAKNVMNEINKMGGKSVKIEQSEKSLISGTNIKDKNNKDNTAEIRDTRNINSKNKMNNLKNKDSSTMNKGMQNMHVAVSQVGVELVQLSEEDSLEFSASQGRFAVECEDGALLRYACVYVYGNITVIVVIIFVIIIGFFHCCFCFSMSSLYRYS